jgi:hypothetical protein
VVAPSALPSWPDEARLLITNGYDNAVLFALMCAGVLQTLVVMPLMMPAMRSGNGVRASLPPLGGHVPAAGGKALLWAAGSFRKRGAGG